MPDCSTVAASLLFRLRAAARYATLLLLALVLWHTPSPGDQTDPQLRGLFVELANAPNRQAAQPIEQEIWSIWFKGPDPEVNEWIDQARDAVSAGNIPTALELFERVTSQYPNYAEGWNQRAIMHFLMGDIQSSLSDIARTLELEPRHFGALAGSGQCYLRLELFEDSLRAFEAALEINPWMPAAQRQVEMLRDLPKDRLTPI